MSRIGLLPIKIPAQTTLGLEDRVLTVKGPLGELKLTISPLIKVEINDEEAKFTRQNESKVAKSLHGLTRSLVANMVHGVTENWQKELEIQGTGYRVQAKGRDLEFYLGFSHPVVFPQPEGINFKIEGNNKIIVIGVDKALVGEVASKIRAIRPPDAYKGKGVRYVGEVVHLKPGKAGRTGAAGQESFGG